MFPQYSLETIMSVVESEMTSDASAMKLMEMEEERSKESAQQFKENQKHHELIKEKQRQKEYDTHKQADLETSYQDISPPEQFKGSPLNLKSNAVLAVSDQGVPTPRLDKNAETIVEPTSNLLKQEKSSRSGSFTERTESQALTDKCDMENDAEVMAKVSSPSSQPIKEERKTALPAAQSYSDLASPALDLLLRGYGGREKQAPEKTSDFTLPAHVVEAHLKNDITTNNTAPTPTLPNNQDLAARKEARRRARRERRERQQREREAAGKLSGKVDGRTENIRDQSNNNMHITNHSNKDRLAVSQSTPALNKHYKSPVNVKTTVSDDLVHNSKSVMRQGASSGYDTGTESRGLDNQSNDVQAQEESTDGREKYDNSAGSKQSEKKTAVKYVCGPKYESSTGTRSGAKSKPSRYESRKAKRYSSRRKTLNYDHYSTDRQDRTSM